MTQVVVPVRYPLTGHSRATLETAIEVTKRRDGNLTVLHVNRYQNGDRVTLRELRSTVEAEFGRLERCQYAVRSGLLVEETILDEIAAQKADVVVVGDRQVGRWREMIDRLVGDPDVGRYLREELDCEIVTASR